MSKFGKETRFDVKDKIILFFVITLVFICLASIIANGHIDDQDKVEIYFFYSKTCPHCAQEKPFLQEVEKRYPRLKVDYLDVSENRGFFQELCRSHNTSSAGVPRTFIGDKVFIGYSPQECDLVWYQGYGAYLGCPNQIENTIRQLMNLSATISKGDAMAISMKDPLVINLTAENRGVIANVFLTDDIYLVAWWTPERIKSKLNYPNVLVTIDAKTGEVLTSEIPNKKIGGILKPPLSEINYVLIAILVLIVLVSIAYMVFGMKIPGRYWISIVSLLIIIFFFAYFESLPSMNIVSYAKQFSFPGFTFIIALIDGFNPCAFAVLAFLLSILTHTRSRKKMLLIGSIFILTSGFMYFLFIMVLLVLRSELLSQYKEIIRILVALIAMIAGIVNIKDFFFFKKGISLTMSAEKQSRIFRRMGKIVRDLEMARSRRDLLFAGMATIVLAAMVNFIELGCTFILPMEYIELLLVNYSESIGATHYLFTAFYGLIYIIPLFAILGSFIYSFKSERVTEKQGRILKLIGGLLMLSLGLILIFKPELLMFGG